MTSEISARTISIFWRELGSSAYRALYRDKGLTQELLLEFCRANRRLPTPQEAVELVNAKKAEK